MFILTILLINSKWIPEKYREMLYRKLLNIYHKEGYFNGNWSGETMFYIILWLYPEMDMLPIIPINMTSLRCIGFPNIKNLGISLPNLDYLDCSNCKSLEDIGNLPGSLTSLNCSGCIKLEKIINLPPWLSQLYCSGCTNVRIIDLENTMISWLECNKCTSLKCLELPFFIDHLNCSDCIKLEKIINLTARMSYINIKNCRLLTTVEGHHIELLNIDYSSNPWLNHEINLWYNNNIRMLKSIQKVIYNSWYRRYLIKRYYLRKMVPTHLAKYILEF